MEGVIARVWGNCRPPNASGPDFFKHELRETYERLKGAEFNGRESAQKGIALTNSLLKKPWTPPLRGEICEGGATNTDVSADCRRWPQILFSTGG